MSDDEFTSPTPTDDDEWVTVTREREPETKVTFDVIGDQFTGTYLGTRTIPRDDGNFTQWRFEAEGEYYFINPLATLREAFQNIRAGSRVRIEYVDDQDTGQASPMKVFRVDVAKPSRHARATRPSSNT